MEPSKFANDAAFLNSCVRIWRDRDTKALVNQLFTTHPAILAIFIDYLDPEQRNDIRPSFCDWVLGYHDRRDKRGISPCKKVLDDFHPEKSQTYRSIERTLDTICDIQMIEKLSISWTCAGFRKDSFYGANPDEWKERKEMLTEHPSLITEFDHPYSLKTASVGSLDCLPSETIQLVFSHLDFVSLAAFRQVSTLGKKLVDIFPAFKNSIEHSSSTILALREAGVLKVHPSGRYYDELTSTECNYCNDFGSLLDVYECERICINCRHRVPSRMANFKQAETYSGLTSEELSTLTVVTTLNGTEHFLPTRYSYMNSRYKDPDDSSPRIPVVSLWEAMGKSQQKLGMEGFKAWRNEMWDEYSRKFDEFQAKHAAREKRRPKRRGRPPVAPWSPEDVYKSHDPDADPYCWWTSTPFPYFDSRNKTHQWGRTCLGCEAFDEWANKSCFPSSNPNSISFQEYRRRDKYRKRSVKHRCRVYLREDIMSHLSSCKWAMKEWDKHLDELFQEEEDVF